MAWFRKPSAADQLRAQIEIEQLRERHATLKAANDRRDQAAAAVAKAEREKEEQDFRKAWIKPWPHSPVLPPKPKDKIEERIAKWVISTALEDGRLREIDRARERHERRQARKARGSERHRELDDDLDLGRGR
jgi:hypothetical protein